MLVVVVRSTGTAGSASAQETRTFEFDQPVITIGRAEVNDIVLPTPKVSKRHARLEVSPHGLVLTDHKSTNGTYLNGRKVMAAVLVGEGDHVHVGEFSIEVKSATGLPKGGAKSAQGGFTPLAQASADTEPNEQNQTSSEETSTRRGAAYRMSWLDDWATPSSQRSAQSTSSNPPSRRSNRSVSLLEGHRRESSMTFNLQASMPGLISVGQHVSLRVWADARMNAREAQSGKQRLSAALEVSLSLPDGKIEAPSCDHGMLQVVNGGQSAEMVISLRGRDVGPARIELAVCHRGARIATLTLRPEIRAMTLAELGELSPHSEIQVSTPLESVLPAGGPQVILRLREFGPLASGDVGAPAVALLNETHPSLTSSHTAENARRRRLKVDLALMHEETAEIVASGEVPLEVPLADRLRTFMASQEVERVGLVADSAREPALQAVGESLAAMLLPPSVREALGGLAPGAWLSIDSAETWVPWELLRVSRGLTSHYLGERFAVTRSGIGSHVARFATMPCVLVTPPGGEALVRREQQALASLDVRLRQVNRLMDALPLLSQPGMAAWHITGHGGFDRADRSGASLRLEEGVLSPVQVMPAARFRKSGQTPPFLGAFVFLAVSEPATPQAPLAPAGTSQWVERFLGAGAGAVVATTFPVSSAKCAQFAETFYRAWSSNRPLSIAAAEAREAIRTDGDPAWLAFAVYGLPGARLGSL